MASPTNNTNFSQWALLPNDLLYEITQRLDKPSDYVRFGAVCKGWLSFGHRNYQKQKHLLHMYQNLPLLLIPTESHLERRGLYSITEDMVYDQFQLHLPYKSCCGSSYGWLFFVEKVNESTLELILLNPFLGDSATIKLPPIKFCPEDQVHSIDHYGVQKAIFSKDPYVSPDDYEVVALYGIFPKLAHYKSGDKFWSYAKEIDIAEVIFYKDLILAVHRHGRIVNFTLKPIEGRILSTDCSPRYLKWNTICEQLSAIPFYTNNVYLVENSKGDLLLVRRNYAPNLTVNFKVHGLCFSSTREHLRIKNVGMKTLDGETLFLGHNNSISVPASKYPGLRPNSIYYTDYIGIYKRKLQIQGMDICNVQNGSICKQFVPSFSTKGMPPPIIVLPQ